MDLLLLLLKILVAFELYIPKCFGKEVNIMTPIEKHFLLALFSSSPEEYLAHNV